jgi:hypothetical protein
MMEPLDAAKETKGNDAAFPFVELFEDSDSEDKSEDVDVDETLHDFLTLTTSGPQLNEETIA